MEKANETKKEDIVRIKRDATETDISNIDNMWEITPNMTSERLYQESFDPKHGKKYVLIPDVDNQSNATTSNVVVVILPAKEDCFCASKWMVHDIMVGQKWAKKNEFKEDTKSLLMRILMDRYARSSCFHGEIKPFMVDGEDFLCIFNEEDESRWIQMKIMEERNKAKRRWMELVSAVAREDFDSIGVVTDENGLPLASEVSRAKSRSIDQFIARVPLNEQKGERIKKILTSVESPERPRSHDESGDQADPLGSHVDEDSDHGDSSMLRDDTVPMNVESLDFGSSGHSPVGVMESSSSKNPQVGDPGVAASGLKDFLEASSGIFGRHTKPGLARLDRRQGELIRDDSMLTESSNVSVGGHAETSYSGDTEETPGPSVPKKRPISWITPHPAKFANVVRSTPIVSGASISLTPRVPTELSPTGRLREFARQHEEADQAFLSSMGTEEDVERALNRELARSRMSLEYNPTLPPWMQFERLLDEEEEPISMKEGFFVSIDSVIPSRAAGEFHSRYLELEIIGQFKVQGYFETIAFSPIANSAFFRQDLVELQTLSPTVSPCKQRIDFDELPIELRRTRASKFYEMTTCAMASAHASFIQLSSWFGDISEAFNIGDWRITPRAQFLEEEYRRLLHLIGFTGRTLTEMRACLDMGCMVRQNLDPNDANLIASETWDIVLTHRGSDFVPEDEDLGEEEDRDDRGDDDDVGDDWRRDDGGGGGSDRDLPKGKKKEIMQKSGSSLVGDNDLPCLSQRGRGPGDGDQGGTSCESIYVSFDDRDGSNESAVSSEVQVIGGVFRPSGCISDSSYNRSTLTDSLEVSNEKIHSTTPPPSPGTRRSLAQPQGWREGDELSKMSERLRERARESRKNRDGAAQAGKSKSRISSNFRPIASSVPLTIRPITSRVPLARLRRVESLLEDGLVGDDEIKDAKIRWDRKKKEAEDMD